MDDILFDISMNSLSAIEMIFHNGKKLWQFALILTELLLTIHIYILIIYLQQSK